MGSAFCMNWTGSRESGTFLQWVSPGSWACTGLIIDNSVASVPIRGLLVTLLSTHPVTSIQLAVSKISKMPNLLE